MGNFTRRILPATSIIISSLLLQGCIRFDAEQELAVYPDSMMSVERIQVVSRPEAPSAVFASFGYRSNIDIYTTEGDDLFTQLSSIERDGIITTFEASVSPEPVPGPSDLRREIAVLEFSLDETEGTLSLHREDDLGEYQEEASVTLDWSFDFAVFGSVIRTDQNNDGIEEFSVFVSGSSYGPSDATLLFAEYTLDRSTGDFSEVFLIEAPGVAANYTIGRTHLVAGFETGDLDGDDLIDSVMVLSPLSFPGTSSRFEVTLAGAGASPPISIEGPAEFIQSVELVDVDGNGNLDLLVSANSLYLYRDIGVNENPAGETIFSVDDLPVEEFPSSLSIQWTGAADLDLDGDIDFVSVTSRGILTVEQRDNNGNKYFGSPAFVDQISRFYRAGALGQLSTDLKPDLVYPGDNYPMSEDTFILWRKNISRKRTPPTPNPV